MTTGTAGKDGKKTKEQRLENYNAYRNKIETIVLQVYYYWMNAAPSTYPPNMNPRVESRNGAIVRRDHLPVVGITKKDYKLYSASDAKYVETIWEFTPNGVALKKRMILQVKHKQETYWSFGSCHSCWKERKKKLHAPKKHHIRQQYG
jgi:hypothetical protein